MYIPIFFLRHPSVGTHACKVIQLVDSSQSYYSLKRMRASVVGGMGEGVGECTRQLGRGVGNVIIIISTGD